MKKKVSLKDIALKANVSTAAVSYVLNNQENRVAPDMAEKIKSIARQLNYQPNQIAKSLKTKKTYTIGLIVANISYRFTTGITHAIEAAAQENRYTVIFGSSDEHLNKFDELVNVLVNRQVDGLILVPVANSLPLIEKLKENGTPFVLIDRYFPEIDSSYIALDNYKAVANGVGYLLQQNQGQIAFINYISPLFHLNERSRGFLETMKKAGVDQPERFLKEIDQEQLDAEIAIAIDALLDNSSGKLAIYFATDTLTIKGLKHLARRKLKVPDDVLVMSFDEAEAFELYSCSITHGRQPLDEMGRLAVDALLKLIDDPEMQSQQLLEADFVAGQSCGED